MHIFLTGDIRIGKSTVIRKTLPLLKLLDDVKKPPFGGFCTYFGPDRANPDRYLYINDAACAPVYDEQHIIARFREGCIPEVYPDRFDTLGSDYISDAQKNTRLIIMDECGRLERDALAFQNEVLSALEGDMPILGVVKAGISGWVEKIRCHPRVRLITVDRENRDSLPFLVAESITGYCLDSPAGSDFISK